MRDAPFSLTFDVAPYRLSGTVYGVAAIHHRDTLAALGDAVHRPPYRAPPGGVVLFVKPRNTFVDDGEAVLGAGADEGPLEAGASLAVVIGRTACRIGAADADGHIAGYLVAADFSIAHDTWYRPQVRSKARDRSLVVGRTLASPGAIGDPDALAIRVDVEGRTVHRTRTGGTSRTLAELVADISDFTTLSPGDLILAGVAPGAPRLDFGPRRAVEVEIEGVGRLATHVDGSGR